MPAPIPPYLALSTIAIEQPLYWDTLTVVCPSIHDVVYGKRFVQPNEQRFRKSIPWPGTVVGRSNLCAAMIPYCV